MTHLRSPRKRQTLAFLAMVAAIWAIPSIGRSTASERVHLVSSSDSRIVFEIDLSAYSLTPSVNLPGTERLEVEEMGSLSPPGAPRVPGRIYLVGIPPAGSPTVSWSVIRSEPLGSHRLEPVPFGMVKTDEEGVRYTDEEYRIDERVYKQGSAEIGVSADNPAHIRHQRILPVRVIPVTYDPVTGETLLATRIRIDVSLRAEPSRTPSGTARPLEPANDAQIWTRVYDRLLVNPAESAKWRVRKSGRTSEMSRASRVMETLSGPMVKLMVRGTGLHRVRASTVIAKGFPSGTPVTDLHVFKRVYDSGTLSENVVDVPLRVVEDGAGAPGEFDGSDWIIFYGMSLREDQYQDDPLEKFSAWNAYWLGPTSGPQIARVAVAPGFVSADTASATFPVTAYFEEDNSLFEGPPPGEKEFYYYNRGPDFAEVTASATFATPSIDPTGSFLLKARILGGRRNGTRTLKLSIRNSKGTTNLTDAVVTDKAELLYTSQTLSASVIDDGANTFRIDKSTDRAVLEALLDWLTVEYRARFRAKGNVLEFNSASLAGDTSLTVTGLGRNDVRLFDVTDPSSPREYTLTPGHFTDTGNGLAVSFREDIASQKKYILTPLDGIHELGAADVAADNPSHMIGSSAESGVDILVVSHADFLGEMDRWVRYRRAQGYRVLMADADDVYDEFNGGVANPRAIKKFITHFFETGGASFVLLVGDASADNRHVHVESGENFVPTESYAEYVFSPPFDEDEIVTTDKWYVMLDSDFIESEPPGTDYYSDLMIGRLPVGSVTQIHEVLDKIFVYESPKADDFWRRRMIRIADNQFSGSPACFQPSEIGFKLAEESFAQTAERTIPGGFDIVRFYLTNYLQGVEPPSGCVSLFMLMQETDSRATPALIRELNDGASLVSFQAHMNEYQICHEALFSSSPVLRVADNTRLTNTERPWVAFGFGCHMNNYARSRESVYSTNAPDGDVLGELILLQNAGSVSTYASSGFEYLTPNRNLTTITGEAFFEDVPTDTMIASNKAQARWILGELLLISETFNLNRFGDFDSGDGAVGQTKRFHLLGDPVLRIDAGPPRFDVTVNGEPFVSGGNIGSSGGSDVVDVRAVIIDEVAIEKLGLEIAGEDSSGILTVTPLTDETLNAARKYEVRFRHHIEAKKYDIVLRAYQAEDTTAGTYHVAAEFLFKVDATVDLRVDGRPVVDGDLVPPEADYVFTARLPIAVEGSLIRVDVDSEMVVPVDARHPSAEDSTTWIVSFHQALDDGTHEVVLHVDRFEFVFNLIVGSRAGLFDLIPYPNPFQDDVYFVFTNDVGISKGSIDVFTVSGKKVAHLEIPPQSRAPGQNAVRWDGRTFNGDEVANGVYLFVASVEQHGEKSTQRGKLVRAK
jgi:hypothetical protein